MSHLQRFDLAETSAGRDDALQTSGQEDAPHGSLLAPFIFLSEGKKKKKSPAWRGVRPAEWGGVRPAEWGGTHPPAARPQPARPRGLAHGAAGADGRRLREEMRG